jgi:hypothetical protein
MDPRPDPRLDRHHTRQPGIEEGETVAAHDAVNPEPGPAARMDTPERRLLAVMRLHAITAVHGQGGLHERLLIEADRFPAVDRNRVGTALAWMSRLHERDRRQREPYARHYADLRVMPTWRRELLAAA